MRQVFSVVLSGLAVALLAAGQAGAGSVEVKGPHICCKQCAKTIGGILSKVDGVSGAKCDIPNKTVTFTATDEAAAKAGVKAIVDGGFFGAATHDGKELKIDVATPKAGAKAEVVTIKGVHMCCGQCQTAAKKLFPDAKLSFEGKGPQKDVRIEGTGLEASAVIGSLRKAGFNGTAEK
jgi:copper chaperone CopZ